MTARLLFRAAVMALVMCLGPSIARAQGPLAGPPTPVPPPVGNAAFKRLDFSIGLYEGYDMTRAFDTRPGLAVDPRFAANTSFLTATGALMFTAHSQGFDFGLGGGANARHYSVAGPTFPVDYYSGFSVASQVSERVRIRASASGSYSPYYAFGNFMTQRIDANALLPPPADRDVSRLDTYTAAGSGGLSWLAGRRTTVDLGYSGDLVTTSNAAYETRSHGGQASLGHRLTRYSAVRVGYGLREYRYGVQAQTLRLHTIDAGLSYRRPLSFSRHTTVGFNVGSAMAGQPHVGGYSLYVTGNASLAHQLSRRWTVVGDYRRDVTTFAGSQVPYLSDGAIGVLTGVFTQKLGLSLTAGYLRGQTIAQIENGYDGWTGTANLRYRLSRYVPIFVEYVFYRYSFDGVDALAPGFPFLTNRHGVRAGLSYSVPIIGRRVA